MRFSITLATLALSAVAFAQPPHDGVYQLGYAANLNIGDSVVNITNDGINGGVFGAPLAGTAGNICANVYVFDPREEEIGCCSCLVTPNGLNSLSAKADLISNNLTPDVPTSIVIKMLGSRPAPATAAAGAPLNVCNPATAGTTAATALEFGLIAWGATLEPASTPGTYGTVNVPFLSGNLFGIAQPNDAFPGASGNGFLINLLGATSGGAPAAGTELAGLTSLCNFIQSNGSNFGICRSCRLGALGGTKQ